MLRRLLRIACIAGLSSPLIVLSGAPAYAEEPCDAGHISVNTYVKVCWETSNNRLWVQDREADGRRAVGLVLFGGSTWECQMTGGAGKWNWCEYPGWSNGTVIYFRGATRNGAEGALGYWAPWATDMT